MENWRKKILLHITTTPTETKSQLRPECVETKTRDQRFEFRFLVEVMCPMILSTLYLLQKKKQKQKKSQCVWYVQKGHKEFRTLQIQSLVKNAGLEYIFRCFVFLYPLPYALFMYIFYVKDK